MFSQLVQLEDSSQDTGDHSGAIAFFGMGSKNRKKLTSAAVTAHDAHQQVQQFGQTMQNWITGTQPQEGICL